MRHRGISMYSSKYRKYGLEIFLIDGQLSLCSKLKQSDIADLSFCYVLSYLVGRLRPLTSSCTRHSVLVSLETAACHNYSIPEVGTVQ